MKNGRDPKFPFVMKIWIGSVEIKDTRVYHNFVGNAAPPRSVGFTRGTVTAALMGVVNGALISIPIDDSIKVSIMAAITPTIALVSIFAFGILDHMLGKYVKDDEN